MADTFNIVPPVVRAEGKDVPPEQIQAGFNTLTRAVNGALNQIVGTPEPPSGPAGGDLGGTYPNPSVVAVHATTGTESGVAHTSCTIDSSVIGGTIPAAGHFTTLDTTTPIAISSGGTGAGTQAAALTAILGASLIPIANGGTNASTAAGARTNLGLGTLATQNANSVAITGGTVDGTPIGQTTPAAGAFTTLTSTGGAVNGTVGATTPNTGSFTTLAASSTVSGTGFSTYLASPPAIGGTAANAGSFTTLSASSTVSGTGFSTYLASPPAIGGTAANTGAFTTLSASSTVSGTGFTARFASPGPIGNTSASTGAFTTLAASSTITPSSTAGIVGTTTNDNANAGSIGEYVTNTATAVSVTSSTAANATSISLTAGDWDVTGVLRSNPAGGVSISQQIEGISTTSATLGAFGTFTNDTYSPSAGTGETHPTPVVRISIAATTTVYLVTTMVFTGGTLTVDGLIRARRVR